MITGLLRKYLLLVALLVPFWSGAQSSNFNFNSYFTDNGFPTNAWHVVVPDSYGFLWLASFDGLYRWDGYSFKKYIHDENDSASLDNNIVYSVYEDSYKRLWIGTIGGLNLYDRQHDQFIKCELKPGYERVPVNTMVEDGERRLWLGTSDGLCRFDFAAMKPTWYSRGGEDDVIWCMAVDAANNVWAGTFNKGLKKYTHTELEKPGIISTESIVPSLATEKIRSLLVDHNNRVWVGTEDKGVFVLDQSGGVVKIYNNFSQTNPSVQNSVNCIYQDKNRRIWFGVSREVLYYLPGNELSLPPVPLTKTALNNNHERITSITSIREDNFGNTWFASGSDGLFSTNKGKNGFRNYMQDASVLPGLKSRIVTSFLEQKDKLWIGTNGSGLFVLDKATNQISRPAAIAMQNTAIRDIKADKNGVIWVVGWGGGLTRYDPANGNVRKYLHNPADEQSLIFNDAKVVLPDDSLVWVGTHGQGLTAFNQRTGKFINYRNNNNRFPFELNAPAWINHLFKDSKNRLWVSTYSGVFVFDGKQLHRYDHSRDTTSLSSNSVNMVAEDAQQQIWIASEGGLDKFEEDKNSFTRISRSMGMPVALKSIIAGKNDLLWIASNEGVIAFNSKTKSIKIYDTNDGLPDNSFYQKAAIQAANGDLVFGGNKGFTVFNPDSLSRFELPDYFYFTDLSINNASVRPGQGPLDRVLAFTDTLTLKPGESFFTIGFTAINLYAPNKTRYAYQLDGMQDQWIDVKEDRRISFMRLEPGEYTLRIRYTDADGQWKIAAKTLHIIMLPPWWKTWWFKVLVALVIAGGIVTLFYARLASIRKRNRLLKREVDRRTNELHVMNASLIEQYDEVSLQKERLEVSNEEVKRQTDKIIDQQQHILRQNQELANTVDKLEKLNSTKDYFFSILAHDLKDPVLALTEMMSYMKSNLRKIDRKELEIYIDNMYGASAGVYELLINLLNWSRSQSTKIDYKPSSWNLREMVEKNGRVLQAQLDNKQIHLEVHVDHGNFVFADYNMIDTVLRNILSNAIKFTDYNGRIEVNAARNGEHIVIRVTDTGVGMSPAQVQRLFSLEKAGTSAGTAGEKGIGLGLVIAKEFIEANKGTIWAESTPEQGSSFYIQLIASDQRMASIRQDQEIPAFHSRVKMDFWDTVPMEKLVRMKGKKVLIVDDNREIRDYLKLLLSDTFEIFEAPNGKDALQLALETPPSIIISDILMPDMNGLDFCRAIKNNTATSHIPVVFLTSQSNDEVQVAGYEAGADVYLTKPIKKELLIQVIINLLMNQERLHESVLESVLDDHSVPVETGSINKLDEAFLHQLVTVIETNISNPDLDAKFLSRELAISRTLLYNKIKTLTGQTVHEFIKSIRLRKSLKLLLEGNLSISQVAYEVGFNSHSYFDKCFIKQYKMGPKEYINKKRNLKR